MQNSSLLVDAAASASVVLPVGATTTTSGSIDTGNSPTGDFVADVEFDISIPALTATEIPDDELISYDLIVSNNSDLSSPAFLYPGLVVQLGAGGAGAEAASYRARLPNAIPRYIGLQATGTANVSAAGFSASIATVV